MTLVQTLGGVHQGANNTTTVIGSMSKTVTVGNRIFVGWGCYRSGITATSVTDNLGNTYTRAEDGGDSTGASAELWTSALSFGGTLTTITVNHPNENAGQVAFAVEFSGIGALDGAAGGLAGTGTTASLSSDTIPAGGISIWATVTGNNFNHTAGAASGSPSTTPALAYFYDGVSDMTGSLVYATSPGSAVTGFTGSTAIAFSTTWATAGATFAASGGATNPTPNAAALVITGAVPVVTASGAGGTTYYIAPTGNDSTGTGAIGSPWATISKFLAQSLVAGDTLYCRGGTYGTTGNVGNYVTTRSGASGAPITIAAYPGETPVFTGGSSTYTDFLVFNEGSSWWVVDGLTLNSFHCTASGVIWMGSSLSGTPTHHITIRRCTINRPTGMTQNEHGIYCSWNSHDLTIEDNVLIGTYPTDAITGKGVVVYHYPCSTSLLVQRNIFDHWLIAFQVNDDSGGAPTPTGSVLHNTFANSDLNIDLRYHSTYLVRDNAGHTAPNGNIYDPNNSASTTADHNYWGQTLTAGYYLVAGDSAIGGASDGSSAGALPYGIVNPTPGAASITITGAVPTVSAGGGTLTLTVGGVDQLGHLQEATGTLKLNTFDFTLVDPATTPAIGDVVTVTAPAWAGVVTAVTRQPGPRTGHTYVTVAATNTETAGASVAPFGLSDSPDDATTFGYDQLSVRTSANLDGTVTTQGTLVFYREGLWPAMTFGLTSADLGYAATDFSADIVTVTWFNGVPRYVLNFGDPLVTMSVWLNSASAGILPIDRTKITDGEVTTPALAANTVTADKLAAELVLSSLIKVVADPDDPDTGPYIEMDPAGITLYDESDVPQVKVPTNGDPVYVRGEVAATNLSSTAQATFSGLATLAGSSVMTVAAGVDDPSVPPVLSAITPSTSVATAPAHVGAGLCYDSAGDAGGATPVFWIGANPGVSGSADVAYEYRASDGALLRTITKSGTVVTATATLGSSSHVADTAQAYGAGASNSQVATPLTMPRAGTITKVSAYLAGYSGTCSVRNAIWDSSGDLLRASASYTAAYRPFSNGNSVQYDRALTSGVFCAAGTVVWAGFLRTNTADYFQYDRDDGPSKTTKRGDGLTGDMTGISTDTASKPNVYITYTYESGSSLEGTMGVIVGVARQGNYVWVLDANGVLFRYVQSTLAWVDRFDLSSHITGTRANAGLFWDGTNLVITTATSTTGTDKVRLVKVTTAGAFSANLDDTALTVNGSTGIFRGGWFDSGNGWNWVAVLSGATTQAVPYNATTGAYVANHGFGQTTELNRGLAWDGSSFRGYGSASATAIWRYTGWDWTTESAVYWVGYAWYDSAGTTHETSAGPRASITLGRRRQLQVVTPAIPSGGVDDPDLVRIYMARSAADPGAGGFALQTTDAYTSRLFSTFASSGAADDAGTPFPATSPAELRSTGGGWSLMGDGGALFTTIGAAAGAGKFVSTGSDTITVAAAATGTQAVSFGVTFDHTPMVFLSRTATGTAPKYHVYATSITATGFTAVAASGDGTSASPSIAFDWFAFDPAYFV